MKTVINICTLFILVTFAACSKDASVSGGETKAGAGRDVRSDMLIKQGTAEELFAKYGPLNISKEEIAKILKSIKWKTNNNLSVLGSKDAKPGGSFTYGLSSYPATLRTEGENSGTSVNTAIQSFIYESMTGMDQVSMETAPSLADKWGMSDDKKIFYFHVDPSAKWADGKPVTAFDYVASWDLVTSDELRNPFTQDYWRKLERPVALDESTVMVKVKKVEWMLFKQAGEMTVYPEHVIGRISAKQYMKDYHLKMLPGTGPYKFKQAKTNESIALEKNKNYWAQKKPENRGLYNFDTVNYIVYVEESILREKFKKGDTDLYTANIAKVWVQDLTSKNIEAIKLNHIIKQRIFNSAPSGLQGISFNMRKEPVNDIRIRKALSMLLPRESMMSSLFYNEYKLMDSFYANSPYENPANPKIRFNEKEAIRLLEDAGWKADSLNEDGYMIKNGKVFELNINVIQGADSRIETIYQEELKRVGIKLNIKQVTWASYIKDMDDRNFTISTGAFGGGLFPYPEGTFHSKYADQPNTGNIWGFKNKRADEICEAYNEEFDINKRIKLIRELDKILMSEQIMAMHWYLDNVRILYWNKFGMPECMIGRFSKLSDSADSIVVYWWYDEKKAKALEEARKTKKPLPGVPAENRFWQKYKKNY